MLPALWLCNWYFNELLFITLIFECDLGNRFWLCQTSQRQNLDVVRYTRVPGTRDHSQQGKKKNTTVVLTPLEIKQILNVFSFSLLGLQQSCWLVGIGRSDLWNGCWISTFLRWSTYSDLWENCIWQGQKNFSHLYYYLFYLLQYCNCQ